MCVEKLREALILLGSDIEETGPFDYAVYFEFLRRHLSRYSRVNLDRYPDIDKISESAPLEHVAGEHGVFSWKYFEEHDRDHESVVDTLDPTYGDELLVEKGVDPVKLWPGICYRYPWVPFSVTMDAGTEAEDGGGGGDRDEWEGEGEREWKYELYDRERATLLAEGVLAEKDGKRVIERVVPDCKDAVLFVDGREIGMRLVKPDIVEDKDIVDMYCSYGEKHTRLDGSGEGAVSGTLFYGDLNLHVVTKDGNDGRMVAVEVERPDEEELSEERETLTLRGIVSQNTVVFDNVFVGYNVYTE
jgi:hypothetical protein